MKYLEEIESEKYISVETYRKNGEAIKTPVWFTIKNNQILNQSIKLLDFSLGITRKNRN